MTNQQNAFRRVLSYMGALAFAKNIPDLVARRAFLDNLGSYQSRGKGRGTPARNFLRGSGRSKYEPHQGPGECARRVRQRGLERG